MHTHMGSLHEKQRRVPVRIRHSNSNPGCRCGTNRDLLLHSIVLLLSQAALETIVEPKCTACYPVMSIVERCTMPATYCRTPSSTVAHPPDFTTVSTAANSLVTKLLAWPTTNTLEQGSFFRT
eukprot:GHUV01025471.1.p1 GENE.GHUV01025471.1~~GHUV01025471.1.p1  ORF type:complete len:123 (-),score=0.22 GHUV01025471.1:134-502(-)